MGATGRRIARMARSRIGARWGLSTSRFASLSGFIYSPVRSRFRGTAIDWEAQGMEGSGKPRVVVIGSGFGGLAIAVRLAARGHPVTVLEKMDAPGGRAYVHRQDGYVFDAGPTIVTAPYLFEELWSLCGRRFADDVTLKRLDPFYEVRFDDGVSIAYTDDPARMRAQIERLSPVDAPAFDRFLETSRRIYDVAFAELADQPFHSLWTLLKALPDMARLGGYKTVWDMVASHFRHPKLRVLFSFHPLLIGGNPLSTTAYYCLISHLERSLGVHYAMGGTGALMSGIVALAESMGVEFRYQSEVAGILSEQRRVTGVRLASGETLSASVVVSNADVGWTYSRLLGDVPRRRWTNQRLARTSFSMSLFVWYFGTNRRYDDVYHHMMVLGPRYEELLRDIFNRKVVADDCSLYLHRPTATDPALAPPGCDAFYVLSPVPNLRGGADWRQIGESYRAKVQARLEETVLPGLGAALTTSRVMTPQTFQDELLSLHGAAFSIEPKLLQSAWFRPHNRSEELAGLYLVGAGTHPGAGLPGVLSSARIVDALVAEDWPQAAA